MFVVFQYPVADGRAFIDNETYKLKRPTFPFPSEYEFIRYTGRIEYRIRGGISPWGGETCYSKSKRAIRFPNLEKRFLLGGGVPICRFRRLYSTGKEVSRFEFGFNCSLPCLNDERSLSKLITQYLSIPVFIPLSNSKKPAIDLQRAGPHLANLYYHASTRMQKQGILASIPWSVISGRPLLYIEYSEEEIKRLPSTFTTIEKLKNFGISLAHTWIRGKDNLIRAWFVGISRDHNSRDVLRRLRINLSRLHAEQECIKEILKLIALNKIEIIPHTEASERLQEYLNSATRLLMKRTHYGFAQEEIFTAALDCENIINEGDQITLQQELSKIRRNIRNKIEAYTSSQEKCLQSITNIEGGGIITVKNINIKIDRSEVSGLVVDSELTNSLNTINNSAASEELKKQLRDLTRLVGDLTKQLSPDKASKANKDLESFIDETTKEKPDKKWYEVSAKGLIEAAKTVATMSVPIIETIKNILGAL